MCLASIYLWISNHLMHIRPVKDERVEISTNSSFVQLLHCEKQLDHRLSGAVTLLPRTEMAKILLDLLIQATSDFRNLKKKKKP